MKKIIVICCVVLLAGSPVHAQVWKGIDIYASSGFSIPVPASDNVAVNYGGGLELPLFHNTSILGYFDYHNFINSDTKTSTYTVIINLKYKQKTYYMDIVRYFLIGLGRYDINYNRILFYAVPGIIPFPENKIIREKKKGIGVNFGLGFEKPISNRFNVFIEVNYLLGIFIEENYLYFPVKCGFSFDL
ncbi:hypothetical protein AMJ80_05020 [bacterium SM23_31]|nr:MAG: hypothetical protein AMJ80_05020 [bacterium SM23_31]